MYKGVLQVCFVGLAVIYDTNINLPQVLGAVDEGLWRSGVGEGVLGGVVGEEG